MKIYKGNLVSTAKNKFENERIEENSKTHSSPSFSSTTSKEDEDEDVLINYKLS